MLPHLALGASFALATSALLIPSTNIEIDQDAEAKAMALAGLMPLTSTLVKLECASCVLEDSEQEDGSGDNAMLLNFMTSGDALLLNDAQIYPTSINFNPLRVPLIDAETSVKTLRWDSSILSSSNNKSRAVTSYGIQSSSSGTDPSGHQTTTVTINLYALDQSPISVDEVHVNLIDDSSSHTIHLQSVTTSPSPNSPSDPNPGNPTTGDAAYKDCAGLPPLLCKWRSIISHKLSGLRSGSAFRKGCHGKPANPSDGTTELKGTDNEDSSSSDPVRLPTHIKGIPPKNRFGSHLHPNGDGPHRHHRHHGVHMFLHSFLRAFVGVLIPVLVGVVAGMAASIIGMAIGQLVAFVYVRVRGGRAAAVPDYIIVEQEERFSIDSEPLPVYAEAEEKGEAPPEYRDVANAEEGKKDGE